MKSLKYSFGGAVQQVLWPAAAGALLSLLIIQQFPELVGEIPEQVPVVQAPPPEPVRSYAKAVRKASPSVVNIFTSKVVRERQRLNYRAPLLQQLLNRRAAPRERIERSLGSGIIIDESGYLISNHHVIAGADQILVMLYDGRESLAQVVGSDPETDIAVLKIDLSNLQPITLGNPDSARVGDIVLAIGNPYGFGHTVTQGIISATGRYGLDLNTYENYIQTDATINRGNSGGALTDADGNLLGVNSAIYSQTGSAEGIGLAIPADTAVQIMQSIIEYGKVVRGWIGVEAQSLTPRQLAQIQLKQGILITAITPDSPAAQAGLQAGDIVTQINGRPLFDAQAAWNQISLAVPGSGVDMVFIRGQEERHTEVIVGIKPG